MPTTKEFKSKLNGKKHAKARGIDDEEDFDADAEEETEDKETPRMAESRPQRRPGRAEKVAKSHEEDDSDFQATSEEDLEAEFEEDDSKEKIEIKFQGSELLRSKFPRPFKVAEAVATDWVHGGKFENLPVGHPLAQWAAQKGLTKAKEIEKKVLESPQLEKAAMSALTWGLKAQELFQKVKSKVSGDK